MLYLRPDTGRIFLCRKSQDSAADLTRFSHGPDVNIAKVDKKHGVCQFCQRFAMDLLPNWTDFRFFVNFVNKGTIFR